MSDNISKFEKFLSLPGGQVVLRNQDFREHLAQGGDIDVLVSSMEASLQALHHQCGQPAWRIHRSYVASHFYPFGHIDLIPQIEWRGADYLENKKVIADSKMLDHGARQPRPAHEALVSWFTSLLWGGFFKARYHEVIVTAAKTDGDELRRVLIHATGTQLGSRLFDVAAAGNPEQAQLWVGEIRRNVWLRALSRRPLGTLWGLVRFGWCEVKLNLCPPTPWIAVLGPDGSGKSTAIKMISERLRLAGIKSSIFHWRPSLHAQGSDARLDVTAPHSQKPRGLLGSVLKLGFLAVIWRSGFHGRIARLRAKAQVVIFDRHYLDLLVDPRRYRYGGPKWLARWVAGLIPNPTLLFLLDAPTAVLQARKQEVSPEETERQRAAYRELVERLPFGRIVDATQSPEKVADAVVAELFSFTTARQLRRQSASRKR